MKFVNARYAGTAYAGLGRGAVEKCNVLRPGKSDEKLQTRSMSGVEQPYGRHGKDPNGIDAGFVHKRKILVDHRGFGKLRAVAPLCEGAVSHAFDEMLLIPGKEELAMHADCTRLIGACRFCR